MSTGPLLLPPFNVSPVLNIYVFQLGPRLGSEWLLHARSHTVPAENSRRLVRSLPLFRRSQVGSRPRHPGMWGQQGG